MTKPRLVANTANAGGISGNQLVPGAIVDSLVSPTAGVSASKLAFTQVGGETRSVGGKLENYLNVLDFIPESLHAGIAAGTYTGDLSVYVQKALNTDPSNNPWNRIFFPAGTYYFNAFMGNAVVEGAGSVNTIIKPYNTAQAAITIVQSVPYWSACKEIRNIGFYGPGAGGTKLGVGVAFGITDPLQIDFAGGYTASNPGNAPGTKGDFLQFAQSVKFYGARFYNLDKGISWTVGNIGSEMYSCSIGNCRYGLYMLNNKAGGGGMQAGCKYWHGGEISGCDVGIYMNNDGGATNGNIIFRDFVIEANGIAGYFYDTADIYNPIVIAGMWDEGNGQSTTASVTVDTWSGSAATLVKGTKSVAARSFIFEGTRGHYYFQNSNAGDMLLDATSGRVDIEGCRVEGTGGYQQQGPLVVSNPATAGIYIRNSWTMGGLSDIRGVYAESLEWRKGFSAPRGICGVPHRASKLPGGYPNNVVGVADGTTQIELASGQLGTIVSDGVLSATCNEFTRVAFASATFDRPVVPNLLFTPTAGYYVCTFAAKVTQGEVFFYIWNRSTTQWFSYISSGPADGRWYTYGSMVQADGTESAVFFDISGSDQDCTWRMADLQILRFDSRAEAQNFLSSGALVS